MDAYLLSLVSIVGINVIVIGPVLQFVAFSRRMC